YVDRALIEHHAAGQSAAIELERLALHEADKLRIGIVNGGDPELAVLDPEDDGILGLAEAPRCRHDRVQYGLQVGGRAADDTEHFARRRLALERFGQLARTRLHFLEQTNVLDRNHRLVG